MNSRVNVAPKSIIFPLMFMLLACVAHITIAQSQPSSPTKPTASSEAATKHLTTGVTPNGKPTNHVDEDANPPPEPDSEPATAASAEGLPILSRFETWITVGVLLFGVFVISMQSYSLHRLQIAASAADVLRLYSSTLVLIGALVLITAGYEAAQVAPAIGLFGTVAGYILGRVSATKTTPAPATPAPASASEGIEG